MLDLAVPVYPKREGPEGAEPEDMSLNNLIGLPWGFGPGEVECLKLAAMAQRELSGIDVPLERWPYSADDYERRSRDILAVLEQIGERVKLPGKGAVLLMRFAPFYHLGTFVSETEFLHIPRGGTSRLTRYSLPYRRITVGIYRIKEVQLW